MDKNKYLKKDNIKDNIKDNTKDNIKMDKADPPSNYDQIDNNLFLPFIGAYVDNNTYIIPIDNPIRDQRESTGEGNADFEGNVVVVKLIPQAVKDITNSPILNDFLKTYNKNHKIVVFDDITDKVYLMIRKKKNIEVFSRDNLMIDLMSHVSAPIDCSFITLDEISHITNPKFGKILENDPLCRYYDARKGQILRIIRASINNSSEPAYRRVIDARPVFS